MTLSEAQHEIARLEAENAALQLPKFGVKEYISLRYATDPIEAFNLFVRQYVPLSRQAHLLDSDENAGQFVRDVIENALFELRAENAVLREKLDTYEWAVSHA